MFKSNKMRKIIEDEIKNLDGIIEHLELTNKCEELYKLAQSQIDNYKSQRFALKSILRKFDQLGL